MAEEGYNLGTAYGAIRIDTSGVTDGIGDVKDTVAGFFTDLGGTIASGAAIVGGATIAVGAGLLDMAKSAAPLQGITNAFKGLTAAAGKNSDETLASLTKLSMGMVDDGDLMTQYNKNAMLVGDTLAGQLPEAYQYLAKIASSTGQDVGQMFETLSGGIGRVNPRMLTQLGITIDQDKAFADYAKTLGKSADQLTKSDKQTALFNVTMQKLKDNTASIPDVSQNASTKLAQMNTKIADIGEKLGTAALPMLGAFTDLMSGLVDKVLPIITPIIESLSDGFTTFFSALSDGVDPLTALGDGLFKVFGEGIRPIVEVLSDVGQVISSFFGQIADGVNPLEALGAALLDTFGSSDQMVGFANFLLQVRDTIANVVMPALASLADWFIHDALPAVVNFVQTVVIPGVQAFFSFLGDVWNLVAPALGKIADWFIHDALPAVVGFVQNTVIPGIQDFINILLKVWNDVQPFLQKLADWFMTDVLPLVIHYVQDVVLPGVQKFIDILKDIWNIAQPFLEKLYDWFITDGLPAITNIIQGAVDNFIKPFIDVLAGVWKIVDPVLSELKSWFVENGLPAIRDGVKNFQDNILTPAINLLKGIWDAVQTPLNNLFKWFRDTFTQIKGFIQPVFDFVNDLINRVTTAIDQLRQLGGGQPQQSASQIVAQGLPANFPTLPSRDIGGAGLTGQAYQIGTSQMKNEVYIPGADGQFVSDFVDLMRDVASNAGQGDGQPVTINVMMPEGALANPAVARERGNDFGDAIADKMQSRGITFVR